MSAERHHCAYEPARAHAAPSSGESFVDLWSFFESATVGAYRNFKVRGPGAFEFGGLISKSGGLNYVKSLYD